MDHLHTPTDEPVQLAEALSTPVRGHYDVIVCGGGPAGVAAATASARAGVRTLLIEGAGCLGGVWTSGLLAAVIDAHKPGSILEEIVGRLRQSDAHFPRSRSMFLFRPEPMKLVVEQLCLEAGVHIRLGTRVVSARTAGRKIRYVVTESRSGREAWSGDVVIDCTGDGDIGALAGCSFDVGNHEGRLQPGSLLGVVTGPDPEEVRDLWDHTVADRKARLLELFRGAGFEPSYGDPTLFNIGRGFYVLMAQHAYGMAFDDADSVTRHTLAGRAEVHASIAALRSVGGPWRDIELVSTADQIGTREGRRIRGRVRITQQDLAAGVVPDTSVTTATFGMDVHSPYPEHTTSVDTRGRQPVRPYGIPAGALIADELDNLMMAGRCISGDFMAHSSYRVTGNASATGEAAGTIAARATAAGISAADAIRLAPTS